MKILVDIAASAAAIAAAILSGAMGEPKLAEVRAATETQAMTHLSVPNERKSALGISDKSHADLDRRGESRRPHRGLRPGVGRDLPQHVIPAKGAPGPG